MYQILNTIQERSYTTAQQRGKDVTCTGCMADLAREQREFWAAVDAGKKTPYGCIATAMQIEDNTEFATYYEENLHNTVTDEMADMLIVAATWLYAAYLADGDDYTPERSIDALFAGGAVRFLSEYVVEYGGPEALAQMVNLKLRFNDLRVS